MARAFLLALTPVLFCLSHRLGEAVSIRRERIIDKPRSRHRTDARRSSVCLLDTPLSGDASPHADPGSGRMVG